MAAESKTSIIVPLNGSNYPTWKVQCRMALVRDGLWGIVAGTDTLPAEGGMEKQDTDTDTDADTELGVPSMALHHKRLIMCSTVQSRRSIALPTVKLAHA